MRSKVLCNSVSFNSMHFQEKTDFKRIIYIKKYAMLSLLPTVHTNNYEMIHSEKLTKSN